jgi:amino acid transporter
MPFTGSAPEHPTAGDVEHTLERVLGVRTLAASIVNITVGGGVFVYPAIVAAGLGAAAWLAYLVCAVAFGLIVLCFAEAGSRVMRTGGPYAYVGRVFGRYVGFLSGVLLWILGASAHAAIADAFTKTVNALVPGAGEGVARAVILVAVFVFFTLINSRGVRQGARLVEVATVAKLLPLALFVIFGLMAITPANLAWPGMPKMADLGRMSMLLVFAFAGVETALAPSGEVKDPSRTVPRAAIVAMVALTVMYVSVQLVSQGILGPELTSHPDAPVAAAATRAFGAAGGRLVLIGTGVSMFGFLSGMMLAMPRTLFAFAQDGYLPRALARVDPKSKVPVAAINTHAAVVCILAISGRFESLVIITNIAALLLYLLCCAAVIELRRRDVQDGGVPFRLPGGPLIPILAIAVILVLLSNATSAELLRVAGVLAVATVLYFFRRQPLLAEREQVS